MNDLESELSRLATELEKATDDLAQVAMDAGEKERQHKIAFNRRFLELGRESRRSVKDREAQAIVDTEDSWIAADTASILQRNLKSRCDLISRQIDTVRSIMANQRSV